MAGLAVEGRSSPLADRTDAFAMASDKAEKRDCGGRLKSLDLLRQRLLFNSLLETWKALCEERSWVWEDASAYWMFETHVTGSGVWRDMAGVCAIDEEEGKDFLREYEKIAGGPLRTINVRLDEETTNVVRGFRG